MASLSLAPLAATIVNELPALIERTLKYNVENNIIENQLVVLQAQIDAAKRNIAAERKTQRRTREKIRELKGHGDADESTLSYVLLLFNLVKAGMFSNDISIPSILAQPDQSMVSQTSVASKSIVFSDSPVSLRTKRKGIVFSDDVRIVKKAKMTDTSAKENEAPSA
ncbi:hypothetical protein EIP91_006899 [Steccherinum ochraceum]|uniref:Uncharacterized protein n=1 Tax=Steccherinum ochraceum TaxID=92696 RepID=A0A4V2MVJ9_9APHY|nr:hypothetical protein EIP91_006899 [Steccherinum ochraceum]